jgi:hypothetical protein
MTTKIHEAFQELETREPGAISPKPTDMQIRGLNVEVKVIDEEKGIVDYIASDESVDSHREIVLAKGWRFNRFAKNAPFVDSHNYSSLERLLGKVVEWRISKGQLIERVQWAVDDEDHTLAQIGWKLTKSGFLKAVSVGFMPVKWVDKWGDSEGFLKQLETLGLDSGSGVRCIYQEQEQIELSACIIGSNANAVARAFKADALSDQDLEKLSAKCEMLTNRTRTLSPGTGAESSRQASVEDQVFLRQLNQIINK